MNKLNLGCFNKKMYGWINVDVRDDVKPDVVDDCIHLKKFSNDSADVIYACHVFEHFNKNEYKVALKRWMEVLKPGGTLRLAVPDFQAVAEYYICFKDLKILQHIIHGSQRHPYDFHYISWDETSLTDALVEAGYENPRRYDWRQTDHFYCDDYSQCYLPEMSYNTRRLEGKVKGKLVSLNMEATKPTPKEKP